MPLTRKPDLLERPEVFLSFASAYRNQRYQSVRGWPRRANTTDGRLFRVSPGSAGPEASQAETPSRDGFKANPTATQSPLYAARRSHAGCPPGSSSFSRKTNSFGHAATSVGPCAQKSATGGGPQSPTTPSPSQALCPSRFADESADRRPRVGADCGRRGRTSRPRLAPPKFYCHSPDTHLYAASGHWPVGNAGSRGPTCASFRRSSQSRLVQIQRPIPATQRSSVHR